MVTTDGNIVITERKEREGTDGFIGLLFGHLARMSATLSSPELGAISGNVTLIGHLIISHVPEPETRKKLRNQLKEIKEEFVKEEEKLTGKNCDDKRRRYFEVQAATEIMGYVIDWINLHVGISKSAKLAYDVNMSPCVSCEYKKQIMLLHPEFVKPEDINEV